MASKCHRPEKTVAKRAQVSDEELLALIVKRLRRRG
jgi:hypothetical protein